MITYKRWPLSFKFGNVADDKKANRWTIIDIYKKDEWIKGKWSHKYSGLKNKLKYKHWYEAKVISKRKKDLHSRGLKYFIYKTEERKLKYDYWFFSFRFETYYNVFMTFFTNQFNYLLSYRSLNMFTDWRTKLKH
jgi:hypothetical protein